MSLLKSTPDDKNLQIELKSKMDETKSKIKLNILDEETYIKKLETIIEKSFFPDLERLKIQQCYYEALKNNDFDTLRDIYAKYNKLLASSSTKRDSKSTPGQTPTFFDTPAEKNKNKGNETPYANEEPPKIDLKTNNETVPLNLSLDNFLAKNTSEDNVSFDALINDAEKKQKAKLHQSWLFEKEKLHQLKSENALMIENGPKGNDDVTKSLDSWTYTTKNTLMYIPDGAALTPEEELAKSKSVRIINHSNTRLSQEALDSLNKQLKPVNPTTPKQPINNLSLNPVKKFDIDGKETTPKETPKIRGYSLVEPSPSPMPGRLAGDESPMMVWGEIDSTPLRLDPSQTPLSYTPRLSGVPEFKIPDIPEREKIAWNLEEKVSAERRKKKNEALKHVQRSLASPSRNSINSPSMSDRINGMSPAAQRLLSLKIKIDKSSSSPLISKSPSSSSNNSPYIGIVSPSSKSSSSQKLDSLKSNLKRHSDSLTDNLLKLPKNS